MATSRRRIAPSSAISRQAPISAEPDGADRDREGQQQRVEAGQVRARPGVGGQHQRDGETDDRRLPQQDAQRPRLAAQAREVARGQRWPPEGRRREARGSSAGRLAGRSPDVLDRRAPASRPVRERRRRRRRSSSRRSARAPAPGCRRTAGPRRGRARRCDRTGRGCPWSGWRARPAGRRRRARAETASADAAGRGPCPSSARRAPGRAGAPTSSEPHATRRRSPSERAATRASPRASIRSSRITSSTRCSRSWAFCAGSRSAAE